MKTIKEELIKQLTNQVGELPKNEIKKLEDMSIIQLSFLVNKYEQLLNKNIHETNTVTF